ncbi:YdcF family protein [Actinoplanes sp. RD1]|uniref:YdcF family protein n=1 Tax=Actinoplanes sp. RD1 TaxID=3064538 RepID=UPI00274240DC|nr:ElyC/SanA/YdcF family protein [Actinoplanes sp. RD1]
MTVTEGHREAARLIWDYHQMRHPLARCEAAIGLADAGYAAELWHAGWFPTMVLTEDQRERAIAEGVPGDAVLVEPRATHTGLTLTLSREVLGAAGIRPRTVMIVAEPAMQRRAYATCRKVWPEVTAVCAAGRVTFEEYVSGAADERQAIDRLVGALQRVIEYPWRGYAVRQEVPSAVHVAYRHLLGEGYTRDLIGHSFK